MHKGAVTSNSLAKRRSFGELSFVLTQVNYRNERVFLISKSTNPHLFSRSFIKRQTSGNRVTTSDNEWYSECQRVTTNDNEWYNG